MSFHCDLVALEGEDVAARDLDLSGDRRVELEDARVEWGRIARDFMREAHE